MSICFIAHRGYSGRFLENTETAFQKAVEHGSGGIETDVRVTLDGALVTHHNDAAVFEDGTTLPIASATLARLTEKPLKNRHGNGEARLCTFRRYLEICRDGRMVCFIELKGVFPEARVAEVFNLAREVYDLDMCEMQSGSYENLVCARRLFPGLRFMYTWGREDGLPVAERCLAEGYDIDMDWRALPEGIVERFRARGLRTGLWTANTPEALDFCLKRRPDYIESDFFSGPEGE